MPRNERANKDSAADNLLTSLPKELLSEIIFYLEPESIIALAVAGKFSPASLGNAFWKEKFKQHFPHINVNSTDWYVQFRKTYQDEYKNLSAADKKLFSIIKDKDVARLEQVKLSLDDLGKKDKNGKTLLDWAQLKDNQAILDSIYGIAVTYYSTNENSLDTKKKDPLDRTILYWAIACHQKYETIADLIAKGSDLNQSFRSGNTSLSLQPIHLAVDAGYLDIAQALITDHPELLNSTDSRGSTPLIHAVMGNRLQTVEYLLAHNDINLSAKTDNPKGATDRKLTALHWAAHYGYSDIIVALLKARAPTSSYTFNGLCPIHSAIAQGHLNAVKAFFEHDPASLNQTSEYGITPLQQATKLDNPAIVGYLSAAKQGVKVVDAYKKNIILLEELISALAPSETSSMTDNKFFLFNTGMNVATTLTAALKLRDIVMHGKMIQLEAYKTELTQGKLGEIYQTLQPHVPALPKFKVDTQPVSSRPNAGK